MGHEMHGVAPCISLGASRPDDIIAAEVLRSLEPLAIEAAIAAMDLGTGHTSYWTRCVIDRD
jgi:hypothetical protein